MTVIPKTAKSMNLKYFTSKNDGHIMTNPVLNDLANVTVRTEKNTTTVKILPYIETRELISNSINKEAKQDEAANKEMSVFEHEREMKAKLIFNLEGLKESGGVIYIACKGKGPKTDPEKITEWFPSEFLNLHKIYAIKEEEAYLLKVFTRNHEATNRGIRKKGGRKVMLMGQEVFGDIMLACGYCGYWSQDGSNVRRHLKKAVCLKEKGYSEEDLIGLDKIERRKFLRRVAAAKCRAKKRSIALDTVGTEETPKESNTIQTSSTPQAVNGSTCIQREGSSNDYTQDPVSINLSSDAYNKCLVEVQETCQKRRNTREEANAASKIKTSHTGITPTSGPRIKRRLPKPKPLMLGPAVEPEVVHRVPFDIYTVNDKMERVAWKPPTCPKVSSGEDPCQIVFKGVRMKRRCMDLPVPMILTYRKLDCKSHHCIFTLFHISARESFKNDTLAKSSVNIKMYGDTVMTQEFYHYFSSLMSLMKMKASQTARHFTSIWESIIAERLSSSIIPAEYRKIITLSKQTVKKVWSSIQAEAGNSGCVLRLRKNPPCKKKKSHLQPTASTSANENNTATISSSHLTTNQPTTTEEPVSFSLQVTQPLHQSCMKRINYINNKPPISVGKSSGLIASSGPSLKMVQTTGPHNNHQPSSPHSGASVTIASVSASTNTSAPSVSHSHWLPPPQQYPHNMHHYPMGPPSAEYYHMPGHFMAQYAPVTIGSSP